MGGAKVFPYPAKSAGEDRPPHGGEDLAFWLDRAMQWGLFALLAFVPWPFGTIHPWSEEIAISAAAGLGICLALRLLFVPHARFVRSWIYLPVGLFFLLALAQLLPLPHALLRIVSPNTLALKSRLLSDIPGAADGPMTLTFYANATRYNLRLVLACSVVFIVTLHVFRQPHRIKRLLICIAVVGGLVALLALAQDVSSADKIYWTFQKPLTLAIGGPFVGHNDFCQFMSLSIGATAALLMVLVEENRSRRGRSRSATEARPSAGNMTQLAVGCLAGLIALEGTTILLSLSRGGIAAFFAAACCVGVVIALRWRLSARHWVGALCLLAIFVGCFYVAFDSVGHRLATLKHPYEQYGSRWQIVKDIGAAWPRFPLFGTGLGTHEFVYPMFEHLRETANFDHAENEYAQMLEETGAVGLALVLLFVGMIVGAFVRASRQASPPIAVAVFGLGLGVLAVFLQSWASFGEHLTSVAMFTAVECALLLNLAHIASRQRAPLAPAPSDQDGAEGSPGRRAIWITSCATALFLVAFGFALRDADRAREAAAAWAPTKRLTEDYFNSVMQLSDDELAAVIDSAAAAHKDEPDNVKYFFQLASCQWTAAEKRQDPNAPNDVISSQDRDLAIRVIHDLELVRQDCPTYGQAVFIMGQLQYLVLDQPQGAELVHLATELSPTNPFVLIRWAYVQTTMKQYPAAAETCRRYMELSGLQSPDFAQVAEVLIQEAKRPDLAIPLAGDNPDRLMDIVRELRNVPGRTDFQTVALTLERQANSDRKALLQRTCQQPDASAADLAALANIYRTEKDFNNAIEYYRKALILDYGQTEWRINLAQTLFDTGHKDEAEQEAAIVLRLDPKSEAARQLVFKATGSGGTSTGQ